MKEIYYYVSILNEAGKLKSIQSEELQRLINKVQSFQSPFDEPFGETEIDTDYRLIIKDVSIKNLSVKRDIITVIIFSAPLVFALFIIYKKFKQRRI